MAISGAERAGRSGALAAAFATARAEGRAVLIPYIMAGYPDRETTVRLAVALAEAGAGILEIGIPFSDPLADGVTIQHASQVALQQGMTLRGCLDLTRRIHDAVATPLVLMGYYNPLLVFGLEPFCAAARAAGVSGLIIPDLPPEEAQPLALAAHQYNLELIYLVTPATPASRLRMIVDAAGHNAFLYCVSLLGVTGARSSLPPGLRTFLARVRAATTLPLAVGFGIATPEQAAEVAGMADGVVVGSALINRLDTAPPDEAVQHIAVFTRTLYEAVKHRTGG
jgi:tryptophan synthase alpha chain